MRREPSTKNPVTLRKPEKPERISKPVPIKSSNDQAERLARPKSRHHHLKDEETKHDVELGHVTTDTETTTRTTSSTSAAEKSDRATSSNKSTPRAKSDSARASSRFKGAKPLQFGLWAHYLAYGAAAMTICMGIFSMLWTDARTYGCKVNGNESISPNYLYQNGVCPTVYVVGGKTKYICCDPDQKSSLEGYLEIGAFYFVYGIFTFLYENTSWGFGLWFPNDTFFYRNRISPIGIAHFLVGVAGLYNYATCLAGSFLVVTGLVYCYAALRNESGDGGREAAKKAADAAAKAKARAEEENSRTFSQRFSDGVWYVASWNPVSFYRRIYNEDKLSSYVWIGLYALANLLAFVVTLYTWYAAVDQQIYDLKHGTLSTDCNNTGCHVNRKIVRYGPLSYFAPWAKACGMCLNLNSALLLLPVVRLLLRKINNYGESFAKSQQQSDFFGKFFAHPMTRYIPLQKNIEFHKICAIAIFFYSWAHMIFHWLNLWQANDPTLRFFRYLKWNGTDYFTGALVTFAMFFIYSAAPDVVRMAKFEVFFNNHHFFILYYVAMFLHGPIFFYFTCIPVLLYIAERYLQYFRGNRPFVVVKVEWIEPVMALYFRPVFKEDFPFKEGQYLYLNCPWISPSEWHPFTISSAVDDLHFGPRICLETGEEVVEVPRPKNLPHNAKWNKYCKVSQDPNAMDPNDYLDKSETGYNDFISLHIKVHGLEDPIAKSWTRKLKEYFELMSPGSKFPFYFSRRDNRGEITIGRQFGPDGKTPILCVDGPHSAPAEHYAHYGTLMLIGAGIGLTPCVSILTSLTKYRWKKNFNPELLHFYWIVRQNEVDSFQWLIHMLTDVSYELKRARLTGQIERRYYCEINIFITGVEKEKKEVKPLYRPKKRFVNANIPPTFTADELYSRMLNPTVTSKDMITKMKSTTSGALQENRLQDVWVWNGRPNWDEIFAHMKEQRQHSDIGVCFCGAPVIGADLRSMCEKYSSAEEDCLFSLHKENF